MSMGGPMPPNYEGMTATEIEFTQDEYVKKGNDTLTRNGTSS
jgi:hypothetical protein